MNKIQALNILGIDDPIEEKIVPSSHFCFRNKDREFTKVIDILGNNNITAVELGAWYGDSAISLCSKLKENCVLFSVDTFVGSSEHYLDPKQRTNLKSTQGFPTFYFTYLSNIIDKEQQNKIIPIVLSSLAASRVFKTKGLTFDFAFIDAGHTTLEVYLDLISYYPLVKSEGLLLLDDWDWKEIKEGYAKFEQEVKPNIEIVEEYNHSILLRKKD